jgi:DNA-binding CsgD family transcriptional regulator/N-acetylneuraminic acid mutarotase
MELVRLVATGATNQQIARDLDISVNTVKVHLRNIYSKLGVGSRTEATMVAVRQGWVDVPRTDEGDEAEGEPSSVLLAPRGPRPVSLVKRVSLLVAILLATALLFFPQLLPGQANDNGDPIGGVFPTAVTGSSPDRWRTRAQMPTPRTGLAIVSFEGGIYAIGGVGNDGASARVEVYDPQADTWAVRSAKPTPSGFVTAALVGDRIYVPGGIGAGQEYLDVLEIYDPALDRWQSGAPLPQPLAAYGLAEMDGMLYLFGGVDSGGYLDSVYLYDPTADRWEELEPMAKARGFLAAASLGNRIYVVGGYDDEIEMDTTEAYDPVTGTWTPLEPMHVGRGGLALVPVRDNLYALGGGMINYLAFNEFYQPRRNAWTRIDSPVTEQWRGLGAALVDPNIYAIGGWKDANLSVNEQYQALYRIQIPVAP